MKECCAESAKPSSAAGNGLFCSVPEFVVELQCSGGAPCASPEHLYYDFEKAMLTSLWARLRLRSRILVGYGIILAITTALTLFLIARAGLLASEIEQLSTTINAETTTSARLTAQVNATQEALERYLAEPTFNRLRDANEALESLTAAVATAQQQAATPMEQQQLAVLAERLTTYAESFRVLNTLRINQANAADELRDKLTQASVTLNDAFRRYGSDEAVADNVLLTFIDAERRLQGVNLQVTRLILDQDLLAAQRMVSDLELLQSQLQTMVPSVGVTTARFVNATEGHVNAALQLTQIYSTNVEPLRQQRDTLLDDQGEQLGAAAIVISTTSLERLATVAADLQRQSQQAQQLALVALATTLLLALAFGAWLARTISRPLNTLVAATEAINQGQYDVVTNYRDGSELGQLARSFDQMAATLLAQRTEVLNQQVLLAERNTALEQNVEELRTIIESRDQLAATVMALSVPVIPLLARVILLPMIGEMDTARVELFMERLLDGITVHNARLAILDITGLPVVDEMVASRLLAAAAAARLLGTETMVVGIAPEVAQTLVSMNADLSQILVRADLRSAVEYAVRRNTR
jgi:anti-anti-sigma regulatory factor/HAMP domain-containing protein